MRYLPILLLAAAFASPAFADPSQSGSIQVGRAAFLPILRREAAKTRLPWDIADAVTSIESGYDPSRIGGVGEIGLMQVRPTTAALLGFVGSNAELMKPETNIHFGVAYLAGAWERAGGDLCRTLMKYRAGHGESAMSARSIDYCARARAHLASVGSPYAGAEAVVPRLTESLPAEAKPRRRSIASLNGTSLRGAAFWPFTTRGSSPSRARCPPMAASGVSLRTTM